MHINRQTAASSPASLTMVSRTRLWKSCSLTDTSSASILRKHNSESSGLEALEEKEGGGESGS